MFSRGRPRPRATVQTEPRRSCGADVRGDPHRFHIPTRGDSTSAEQGDRTNAHVAALVDSGPGWFGRGSSLGVLLVVRGLLARFMHSLAALLASKDTPSLVALVGIKNPLAVGSAGAAHSAAIRVLLNPKPLTAFAGGAHDSAPVATLAVHFLKFGVGNDGDDLPIGRTRRDSQPGRLSVHVRFDLWCFHIRCRVGCSWCSAYPSTAQTPHPAPTSGGRCGHAAREGCRDVPAFLPRCFQR